MKGNQVTEQERIEAFGKEFDALVKRYGVSIGVELVPEALGPVIQVRAVTKFAALPNWQPQEAENGEVPEYYKALEAAKRANGSRD